MERRRRAAAGGGPIPTFKYLKNADAASTLKYPVTEKGNSTKQRVLHITGVHCTPDGAVAEFSAVRAAFGTQGAERKVRGRWKLPEEGQVATHVRRVSESGRGRWVLPQDGETATHLYEPGVVYEFVGRGKGTHKAKVRDFVEADGGTHIAVPGGLVREHEVGHGILSFSLAEVNPDDPRQVAAAFEYAAAMQRATRPGVQAVLVGQADGGQPLKDGEGGKFHIHIVENMTVYDDMAWGGKTFKAGSKLAGELTDIHRMRDAQDAFLDEHGHEYGLGPQKLPPSSKHAQVKLSHDDRRKAAQGKVGDYEQLRQMWDAAEEDARVVAVADMVPVLEEMGAEANHRITKTGRNAGQETLTLKLPHMPNFVGAKRLGSRYAVDDTVIERTGEVIEGLRSRLEMKAGGLPRPKRPEPPDPLPPRPVEPPTPDEIDAAVAVVTQLALAEEELDPTVPEPVALRVSDPTPSAHAADVEAPASAHAATGEPNEPETVVQESAYDEQAWVEDPPTKPEETFTQAGARGVSWEELRTLGQAWDEWRAYEHSEVYAAHQEAAKAAAEAAAAAPEPTMPDSAHAASAPASPSAHAAVEDDGVFASRFTGLKVDDPKEQGRIDAMAAFENTHQPTIVDGGRVGEAKFPKGIGPAFIKRHGEVFDVHVLELLVLREQRKEENRKSFDQARKAAARIEEIRVEREVADPLNWYLADDVKELNRTRKLADRRRAEQVERMAVGDFEPASGRRPREQSAGSSRQSQAERDRTL